MIRGHVDLRGDVLWRRKGEDEELVARGEQVIACMRREGDRTVPAPIPVALREALKPYEG